MRIGDNMYYFNQLPEDIKSYFQILSGKKIPSFLFKYLDAPSLKRLQGIGQFCGCDYTGLHNIKTFYSRFDHSVACSLITWHLTADKTQTLAALLHDIGTPAFSHCIDFLLQDHETQSSSEKSMLEMAQQDETILEALEEDGILIQDIIHLERYTIVENKNPQICVDRLESVLASGLYWGKFWTLKDIAFVYQNMTILINEQDEQEIGFEDIEIAEHFFHGSIKNSILLQSLEDKFTMQFIADILQELITRKKLTFDMLYQKSEQQIIQLIHNEKDLKPLWKTFNDTKKIVKIWYQPVEYAVKVKAKKRYTNPLVYHPTPKRILSISPKTKRLFAFYEQQNSEDYGYIPNLFPFQTPTKKD